MKSIRKASVFLCKIRKNIIIFLNKNINKFLDILYPKQCMFCGKIGKEIICENCYNTKLYYKIENECEINRYHDKYFNEHLYIFKYKNEIRNLIIDYKFNDKAYLYEFFFKIILKNKKICRKLKKYDIIIPVPIHIKRKRQRGYNQSEIIARKIAYSFNNLKLITNCLIKSKNTIQQSKLTKKERIENVKQVYKIQNREKIENKKVILFDDIYTTGSTVNECARVLKDAGAKDILIFTIAKD